MAIGLPCILIFVFLAIAANIFWLWMFIECLVKEPSDTNDKILWALVIFFGHLLGAVLYLVVRRHERIAMYGE
ncbi:PLDc N-terminal domain-containing protein [Aeoliella mucimassa]|uniref:PLDc N-terminal domain-containing protein n=1 Tax=Aeoliella mucimassa TaxID=2527972 RepID=UPI0018D418EB|nr:PLDc N-terminal domain-containing protein [Aeoliella mucimassa]